MPNFFTEDKEVNVSQITDKGWWVCNTTEHVAKGTALGDDFTQHIYTPSAEGKIARYNRTLDEWEQEVDDMTFKPYFDKQGKSYVIGQPDGEYPEWAIKDAPPAHDKDSQTVLYDEDGWRVFDIKLGEPYFDENGFVKLVSDYNFTLPDNHSWDAPPDVEEGQAVKLIGGSWCVLRDLRNSIAYAKNRTEHEDYVVQKLGDLPNTHTEKPYCEFCSWDEDNNDWLYDVEIHRPYKTQEEKLWRDDALKAVLDRIDQYEKDQGYPTDLRTSSLTESEFYELLVDRKALCDYPQSNDFPFGERPVLSQLTSE